MEFSRGLLVGVLASVAVALPAALRADAPLWATWLAIFGSTALFVGPAAGALRWLRPMPRGLWVLGTGVILAAPALMLFGEVLQRGTHHRPLGAVTFSLVGLGVLGAGVAAAVRLHQMRPRWRWIADACLLAGAALPAMAFRDPALRWGLLDGALACGGVLAGARLRLPPLPDRAVRVLGPALWALGVAACVILLRAVPETQSAGPVLQGASIWIAG